MKVSSPPPGVTAVHFQGIPFGNYNFQDSTLRNRLRPTVSAERLDGRSARNLSFTQRTLNFLGKRRMLRMQTNLSA